ncbi:group xv phospholipase a2 [Anaeramoeba ignava]|uniref:Group xv phospholipase a2 n=1 Tax=Anaeramoeba ignava TaxID=1746090 RepID=A0A9Q0LRY2_ANAIG|nr:group xv phospholipase a2 [Anaeramoeba ignava]
MVYSFSIIILIIFLSISTLQQPTNRDYNDNWKEGSKLGKEFLKTHDSVTLNPILIMPGLAGTKLQAELKDFKSKYWFCKENEDWFRAWVAVDRLVPELIECWIEMLSVEFNSTTQKVHSPKGATVRPVTGSAGISDLDPELWFITGYFAKMIAAFEELGYIEGKNMFPMPFDWRLAPFNLTSYLVWVKDTIEYAYKINGNTSVVIVTHSMGGSLFVYLASQLSTEWKQKYIAKFIPISPAWGGVISSVRSLNDGFNLGIPFIIPSDVAPLERTLPSIYYFLPNGRWWKDPVVTSPSKNYYPTIDQYHEMITELGLEESAHILLNLTYESAAVFDAPQVPTHILYGTNVKTPICVNFKDKIGGDYDLTYGNGDGTCNHDVVITACSEWPQNQKEIVTCQGFDGIEHTFSVEHDEIINAVLGFITQ